jgi:hypothetical protein
MIETIAVVMVVLWLLGFFTSYTMGGLIHILLVIDRDDSYSCYSRSTPVMTWNSSMQRGTG